MKKQIALYEYIDTLTLAQKAQIWCVLNSWEWPEILNEHKPSYWREGEPVKHGSKEKQELITQLMNYVCSVIGFKECLRCWNTKYPSGSSMTNAEFESWWSTTNLQAK